MLCVTQTHTHTHIYNITPTHPSTLTAPPRAPRRWRTAAALAGRGGCAGRRRPFRGAGPAALAGAARRIGRRPSRSRRGWRGSPVGVVRG